MEVAPHTLQEKTIEVRHLAKKGALSFSITTIGAFVLALFVYELSPLASKIVVYVASFFLLLAGRSAWAYVRATAYAKHELLKEQRAQERQTELRLANFSLPAPRVGFIRRTKWTISLSKDCFSVTDNAGQTKLRVPRERAPDVVRFAGALRGCNVQVRNGSDVSEGFLLANDDLETLKQWLEV